MTSRRTFLLGSSLYFANPANYHLSLLRNEVSFDPPQGKRIPFGWKAFRLEKPTILGFKALIRPVEPSRFRLAVALDSREESRVEVYLPQGHWEPAIMDIRYPGPFQTFEVELDPDATQAALRGGIGLRRITGQESLMFFAPDPSGNTTPSELQPHLMVAGNEASRREFEQRLLSGAALQPWGWKLGCVLDGLLEMEKPLGSRKARQAFDRLIKLYYPAGSGLVYEGVRSEPKDGVIYGVEGVLPFGPLARRDPKHPGLDLAVSWCRRTAGSDGVISDGGGSLKTEECYTISYPLAVLGNQRKDQDLTRLAIKQLRARRGLLVTRDTIFQRGKPGQLEFRNWARGIGWYLLGHAHSLAFLPKSPDLEEALQQGAEIALRLQRPDGLWSCFAEESATGFDTSGSAGIAAALALGAKLKVLGPEAMSAARKAAAAIEGNLTPDGWVSGVAQENRGGEALQRGGYRCHAQFAMGLYAQLLGAIA